MTLGELVKSIHELEAYLKKFEEKYLLRSEDFYQLVTQNKLDQNRDFIEWLGVYEIKLKREQKYQKFLSKKLAKRNFQLPLKDTLPV